MLSFTPGFAEYNQGRRQLRGNLAHAVYVHVYKSDELPFIIGLVISIIFGLLLAGIFANLGDDQASIQDRQGLLFFIIVNQAFGSIFGVINTFPAEK